MDDITEQTAKIGSLVDVQDSEDPEGLRVMYYLVQDLKVSTLLESKHKGCCRIIANRIQSKLCLLSSMSTAVLDLQLDCVTLQDQTHCLNSRLRFFLVSVVQLSLYY